MRPRPVACAAGLAVTALGAALGAQTIPTDEQRSAWRYRREVVLPAGSQGTFAAVPVPPELAARGQRDLGDLRLVAADGTEVPYVVDRVVERERTRSAGGILADTRREPLGPAEEGRGRSVWEVDLGQPLRFDAVTLEVGSRDFAKRVRVEASEDRQAWRVLREDAGVFDAPWSARVHHTTIELAKAETTRYLRLTTQDDRRSPPIEVSGVHVAETRRGEGEEWRRPVGLEALGRAGASRYRLDLPAGFPVEEIRLEADDPAFARRVRVLEAEEAGGRTEERALADGLLYRVRLADAALAGECLSLRLVPPPSRGTLLIEVQDGDSPPLRRLRVVAAGTVTRLLFAPPAGVVTLYHGNDVTRAPLYDLAPLRERLALSGELVPAALGPERENPRHAKPAPLPFTAARGAAVEAPRWRSLRRVSVGAREDLWSLTLAPEDLAAARPDLADLRIVDEADRQVPYTLEPGAAEGRVALAIERDAAPPRDRRTTTRYRLVLPNAASRKAMALPLALLELDVQEGFFDRPFRLLAPAGTGDRHERVVQAGRLARRVDPRVPGAANPAPLGIGLDGSTTGELLLEIDEGDNAPLTLQAARAVVRVPRLTFKAAPGAYRLLLGNREAAPPRYDLASLRQEVLSYSSVAASATPLEANSAYRRFAGDYFTGAPPTLLLWGTLIGAVVALLLLTARVLRQPPA